MFSFYRLAGPLRRAAQKFTRTLDRAGHLNAGVNRPLPRCRRYGWAGLRGVLARCPWPHTLHPKPPPLFRKFSSTAASHSGLLHSYYFHFPVTSQNTAGIIRQPNHIQFW